MGTERRRRRLRRGSPVSPEPDTQTPVADEPAAEAGGGRVARPPSPLDLADLGSAFAMTAGIQDPAAGDDEALGPDPRVAAAEPPTAEPPAGSPEVTPDADSGAPDSGQRASRSPISFLSRRRSADSRNRSATRAGDEPVPAGEGVPPGEGGGGRAGSGRGGTGRASSEGGTGSGERGRGHGEGDSGRDGPEPRGSAARGNGHPRSDHDETGDRGDDQGERGLRGLVGGGSSQVGVAAAMRARDATRPGDDDIAAAEADLVIVRRGWIPREDLPPRGPRR